MRHILQWIFVFAAALASVFTLQSCGLEEPFPGPQSGISEGTVEFVARPAGYNNHDVTTKADGDFDDAEIHNAFLLLFNNEGKRILCEEINNKDGQLSAKIDRGLGGVSACILANVPASFAQGIIGATNPNSEPNLTDGSANGYLNTAVLDLTYNSTVSGTLGVPVLNLDDDTSTAAVPCIPMIGQTVVSTTESKIQISLSRLFAKISVNLGLDIDLDNWSADIVNYASFFQLTNYQVVNLPTKVKLVKEVSQSKWSNSDSFDQATSGTLQNNKVYNGNTTSFEFYVPEYYIDTLTEKQYYALSDDDDRTRPNKSYGNAKFKPLCYNKETTKPIYLLLTGSYSQFSYNTTNLQYEVYLGRDEHSDFTLERNVKYNNILTINGVKNNNQGSNDDGTLDHRVTTDVINNPVAVAGQSANCYIIGTTGQYKFPAYKGAYNNLTKAVLCNGDQYSTVVDWTAGNHNGIELRNLTYDSEKNMILFEVTKITNGNVIIALQNADKSIEWSWHLWCSTESTFDAFGWGAMKMQTYPSGADMMDRNLGATALGGDGLYYQYGNKNPFINNEYRGGGTNEPNTWDPANDSNTSDATKAVNDPCPPGYKVPSSSVWSGSKGTDATTDALFSFSISPAIGYSYTGWLDSTNSNKYSNTLSSKDDIIDAGGFSIDISKSEGNVRPGNTPNEKKKEYRIVTITERKYVNIKYNVPTTQKFGAFWTSISNTHLKYYNYRADWSQLSLSNLSNFITITACDVMENIYDVEQVRQKGLIFWGDWEDINGTKKPISNNTTKGDPTKINSTSNKTALFYDQRDLATLGAANVQSVPNTPNGNGCKIRCVSELSKIK